ncbi:MAG: hypothetical protein KAT43_03435 [Nanoarchaeota archaeon]|nr:hypothetical protein [Nanoarchaeota archaeon]
MDYMRRTWDFAFEKRETITRLYLGIVTAVSIPWEAYFVQETFRAGSDLLYSQNVQEAVQAGSEVLAGGALVGVTGLAAILSAVAAVRGFPNRNGNETNDQLQEQI